MNNNETRIQGWKDVVLDGNSPLGMLIDFLNVLNSRLVAIEDNTFIDYEGEKISLTEMYKREAEAELAKREASIVEDGEEPTSATQAD